MPSDQLDYEILAISARTVEVIRDPGEAGLMAARGRGDN